MRHWLIGAIFAVGSLGGLGFAGCDSDEADELLQCADICNAYLDCTNSDMNVDDCIDACEDQSSNTTPEFEDCEDCVDSNACEQNVWQCDAECAAVIDQSTVGSEPQTM